jgi:antitoxin MazE
MRAKIIKIGNSQGIRIPKVLIEESGLSGEVEITVRKNSLVIEPSHHHREGWDEAFKKMADASDDLLIDGDRPIESTFDMNEWEW